MPSSGDPHFTAACKSLINETCVREMLNEEFGEDFGDILEKLKSGQRLPAEHEGAYDVIIDVLINEAPVIKEYEAEQDKGVYSIQLRGVSGAYFVTAPEYSDSEMFRTQEAADHHIQMNFGEFIKE